MITSWARRSLVVVIMLAIVAAIAFAFWPKPVPVEVAVVRRGPMRELVEEDGKTRVRYRYTVSAPVAGQLERIRLRAGDWVRAGEELARLHPADAPLLDERTRAQSQAQLRAAEAAWRQTLAQLERARLAQELAKKELARVQALVQAGAVSRQTLDTAATEAGSRAKDVEAAHSAVRIAHYQVQVARAMLARPSAPADQPIISLPAPVQGRVLRVHQESAAVVAAGSPLLDLGDPTTLEVAIDVLTIDAVRVGPGQAVELVGWGGEHALQGTVRHVEPSAYTKVSALGIEEQRVDVVIDPAKPGEWNALGDGFRVEARIAVWESQDELKVPVGAAFRDERGWAVFVVVGGRAVKRPMTVGRRNEQEMQVLQGLQPGDHVILHPSDKVGDGTRVSAAMSD